MVESAHDRGADVSPSEIAQTFYELFGAGKIEEAITRFIGPQSVLDNPLPDPIPFGGRFVGPDGFAAYMQGIAAAIEIEEFSIDEMFADGERVAVLGRETSRVMETDKHYTMSWVHIFTIRHGRIDEFREYNDTATMAAAFV
jgi:ketosteroid isomerase-like protein